MAVLLATQGVFSQTVYEAGSAVLSRGASLNNCAFCFGGRQIQNIGGPENGTATFDGVRVPCGGVYPLTVYFHSGDDRAFTITINENARFDVIFHPSAGSHQESRQTVLVPLNAGTNTITFSNAHEFGPDLDAIVIGSSPIESFSISGTVSNFSGRRLAGVEVFLSGLFMRMKTMTDARGGYQFPFLPRGDYYVRPQETGLFFSPYEQFCRLSPSNTIHADFAVRNLAAQRKTISVMELGKWRIRYDLAHGLADIFFDGKLLIPRVFAEVRLPQAVTSLDYQTRKVRR
ncbi:MAG TPA: carboxypeptidase regulatory-like domain-containing protein, partial [Verrucomicrobiae bacterium]|nr:carboxypeptidase regulatory-like domain-containing protein [Verrucomicrobiae bacterium]